MTIRLPCIFPLGILTACLIVPAGLLAGTNDAGVEVGGQADEGRATAEKGKPAAATAPAKAPAAPPAKPKRTLSPAQTALRDLVRGTLAMHQKLPLNTRDNSATEITSYCLAFGCASEVLRDGADDSRVNGITCLCWGYPCAGFELLGLCQGHVAPRIGYGCQEHPGEFLAMLAIARVQTNYPVRVGRLTRTVADIVEVEKQSCRAGDDLSLKLLGLSYYTEEPQWKNDLGETWSLERMIGAELAQPVLTAPEGGLNRLMGLSYAIHCRMKREEPIEGEFRAGAEVCCRLSEVRPAAAKRRRQLGAVLPGRPRRECRSGLAVAARPAACWNGWRPRSPKSSWKTPASPAPWNTWPTCSAASGTRGARRRFPRGRSWRWATPCMALALYDERVFKPADGAEKPAAGKPAADKAAQEASPPTAARRHATSLN